MTVDGAHRSVVVMRPTVSGIDEASAWRIVDGVREASGGDVRGAFLDIASPSIHEVLDQALADSIVEVTLLPVAVPRDKYLNTWTSKAVANWRETRENDSLSIVLLESGRLPEAVVAAVSHDVNGVGDPVTVSPASYRSPAWSVIEKHERHLLVCKGPRCMAYGAGPLHRALTAASKGTTTKVTGTGCLSPCNLGPLVISNPGDGWYGSLDVTHAESLVRGCDEDLQGYFLER